MGLHRGMSLLLGKPATKEDVAITFPEVGDQITPTITIKIGGKSQAYEGTPYAKTATKEEKKEAKAVAVLAALTKNRPRFAAKVAEAEAKKGEKKLKFKERIDQLKEEAKQAKAAKAG